MQTNRRLRASDFILGVIRHFDRAVSIVSSSIGKDSGSRQWRYACSGEETTATMCRLPKIVRTTYWTLTQLSIVGEILHVQVAPGCPASWSCGRFEGNSMGFCSLWSLLGGLERHVKSVIVILGERLIDLFIVTSILSSDMVHSIRVFCFGFVFWGFQCVFVSLFWGA